jgi:hypothetical protein
MHGPGVSLTRARRAGFSQHESRVGRADGRYHPVFNGHHSRGQVKYRESTPHSDAVVAANSIAKRSCEVPDV